MLEGNGGWRSRLFTSSSSERGGRAAGLTDKQIQDTWTSGAKEQTIARALKSPRKPLP